MADNSLNISPPFKFEIKTPARGMTDFDPGALNRDQQHELNSYKISLMKDNMQYLFKHPEVKAIHYYMAQYGWKRQSRDIMQGVSNKFRVPEQTLRRELKQILSMECLRVEDELAESDSEDWDY